MKNNKITYIILCALLSLNLTACGSSTTGGKSPADYDSVNLSPVLTKGKTAPIVTSCIRDTGVHMSGNVKFTEYKEFKKDKYHTEKEGYVWKCLKAEVGFSDDDAASFIPMPDFGLDDYYDTQLYNNSLESVSETLECFDQEAVYAKNFKVCIDGQEYECKQYLHSDVTTADVDKDGIKEILFSLGWDVQVPEGYDGMLAMVYPHNSANNNDTSMYDIYKEDEFITFRMQK